MRPRFLRTVWLALILMATGCVERRLIVETTPPGARVFVNDVDYGISPAYVPFTYYGTYNFRIMADGYQTQTFKKRIKAPWYAYPPLDFFVETFWPFQISDIRPVACDLMPAPPPDLARLKAEGAELRAQGKNLPPPTRNPFEQKQTGLEQSRRAEEIGKARKNRETREQEQPEIRNVTRIGDSQSCAASSASFSSGSTRKVPKFQGKPLPTRLIYSPSRLICSPSRTCLDSLNHHFADGAMDLFSITILQKISLTHSQRSAYRTLKEPLAALPKSLLPQVYSELSLTLICTDRPIQLS